MKVTARPSRVPLTGAILAASALLAAGCNSSSSGSSSTSSSASPSASVGSASGSASPSGTPSPSASPSSPVSTPSSGSGSGSSGSAAGGSPACATSNLSVTIGGTQGAAGSSVSTIDFTNTGSSSCTLYGYPGVSLTNSSGSQIGAAATRDNGRAPATVTLSPGGKANALLKVAFAGNYPSSACGPTPATSLRVYPPGQTQALQVSYKTTACSHTSVKQLSVQVVSPGATSSSG